MVAEKVARRRLKCGAGRFSCKHLSKTFAHQRKGNWKVGRRVGVAAPAGKQGINKSFNMRFGCEVIKLPSVRVASSGKKCRVCRPLSPILLKPKPHTLSDKKLHDWLKVLLLPERMHATLIKMFQLGLRTLVKQAIIPSPSAANNSNVSANP
jgi:hypothetical protein